MSVRDLENETRELRARIASLVEEAANNERLLKRSQQRELELLKAETLGTCADGTAAYLDQETTVFPSHHGGFLDGSFGWAGQPEAFAAKLREVLAAQTVPGTV